MTVQQAKKLIRQSDKRYVCVPGFHDVHYLSITKTQAIGLVTSNAGFEIRTRQEPYRDEYLNFVFIDRPLEEKNTIKE